MVSNYTAPVNHNFKWIVSNRLELVPGANCTCKHQSFLQHFKLSSAGTCDPICLSVILDHIK